MATPPPAGRVTASRKRRGTGVPGIATVAVPSAPVVAVAPVGAGAGGAGPADAAAADSSSPGPPATGAGAPTPAVRETVRRVSVATADGAESVNTGCGVTVSPSSGTSRRVPDANGSLPATSTHGHSVLASKPTAWA